jgi:hypothetical protein
MFTKEESYKSDFSCDSIVNLDYFNNNTSYQTLPNFVLNQFNKALITGINQMSELSTKNSGINLIKDKHMKMKKKFGICSKEELTPFEIDEIFDGKKKAFEALENLLLNDEIFDKKNGKNEVYTNNSHIKDNININQSENTLISKKEKKSISVPKLDLTNILNEYKNSELYIKEVKNVSKLKSDNINKRN